MADTIGESNNSSGSLRNGSTPVGIGDALLYTQQTLTESQLLQVYANLTIGSLATLDYEDIS